MKKLTREERINKFFTVMINTAIDCGLEFIDDCGHVSVRDKVDNKNHCYTRIDDVIEGNNLMVDHI